TANSIVKSRFGVDSIVSTSLNNGLLDLNFGWVVGTVDVPPVIARLFDLTRDEYNEMSYTLRLELLNIAKAISSITGSTVADLRPRQNLTDQGDRLIDCVRHDDYYTLHKTLRDLRSRLTSAYEFTVFAADKDYHSVNFGLMTTYRQFMTPLTYQPGDLVT